MPSGARGPWRPLLLRLHFYAGVLVAPFLAVAALTGLAYTAAPTLDRLVYADELRVDRVGPVARPLADQINAARAAHPEGMVSAVRIGAAPDHTTQVVLDVPGLTDDRTRTVYVDPYTARVQGTLITWWGSTPLTTWLDDLHRDLHLGAVGRTYSELAASWLWVVVAGGAILWIGRRRGARRSRRTLLPDLGARGRRRTMGWHGGVGLWLVVGLVFLSATGLTWSRFAGGHFGDVLDATSGRAPELATALPAERTAAPGTVSAPGGARHPGAHHRPAGTTSVTPGAGPASGLAGGAGGPDAVLAVARRAGLAGPVEIDVPDRADQAWTVTQTDRTWPVRLSGIAVDPSDGHLVDEARWADFPLLAKLTKLGVAAHMGLLFGLVNRLLLASLALGLLCVIVWGYRMWWQRRPRRADQGDDRPVDRARAFGPAPGRGGGRRLPAGWLIVVIAVSAAVGWALPVLGVTLLAFLLLDAGLGAVAARR